MKPINAEAQLETRKAAVQKYNSYGDDRKAGLLRLNRGYEPPKA